MCRRHGRKLMWFGMIHTGAWRVFNALRLYIFKRFCCCVNQPTVKMNVIFIEPTVCIFQMFHSGSTGIRQSIDCMLEVLCLFHSGSNGMRWIQMCGKAGGHGTMEWNTEWQSTTLVTWNEIIMIYIYILLDFISWLFSYSLVVVYEHLHWGWQFWTLGSTDWMIYTWVSEWLKLDDWNWIHPRMTKRELELKGAYWKGPIILTMFTNPVLLWTAGSGSEKELVAAASVLASKGSPA